MRSFLTSPVLTFLALALLAHPARANPVAAAPADAAACLHAIEATTRAMDLPADLLKAIALVESGRLDPVTGRITPWPWAINVEGSAHYYLTKAEAIDAVQVYQALGIVSIDVGCMQVNLYHHPAAFASLEDAFDPGRNIGYGARFLVDLYRRGGGWPQAIAAYHSQTPAIGAEYWSRVSLLWPLAGQLAAPALKPAAPPANDNRAPALIAKLRSMDEDRQRILASLRPAGQALLARSTQGWSKRVSNGP